MFSIGRDGRERVKGINTHTCTHSVVATVSVIKPCCFSVLEVDGLFSWLKVHTDTHTYVSDEPAGPGS